MDPGSRLVQVQNNILERTLDGSGIPGPFQFSSLAPRKRVLRSGRQANIAPYGITWPAKAFSSGTNCQQEEPKASKLESRAIASDPRRLKMKLKGN